MTLHDPLEGPSTLNSEKIRKKPMPPHLRRAHKKRCLTSKWSRRKRRIKDELRKQQKIEEMNLNPSEISSEGNSINSIKTENPLEQNETPPQVLRVRSLAELGDPSLSQKFTSLSNPLVQKHLVSLIRSNLPENTGKRFMLNTSSTGVKFLTPINPGDQSQVGKRFFIVKDTPPPTPSLRTEAIMEPVPEKQLLIMQRTAKRVPKEPTISAKLQVLKMQSTVKSLAEPHFKETPSKTLFNCAHCRVEFPTQTALADHLRTLKLQCHSCGEVCRTIPELKTHLKKVHKIKGYKCSNCSFFGTSMWDLKLHQSRDHCQEYLNPCEECDKVFKNPEVLEKHVKLVHESPSSSSDLLCEVCGKPFKNYYTLQRHIESTHAKSQLPCKECDKILPSRSTLARHMKWHANKNKIVCELCGKSFTMKFELQVHMRQHTGEKPYQCSICSKAFAKRTTLRQHLLIHTGVRPYVCDICGKSFTQKPGLTGHRKSHPGELPPMPSLFIDDILKDLPEDAFQNLGPKPKTIETENVEGNGNEGEGTSKGKETEGKKEEKNDETTESKQKAKGKNQKEKKGRKRNDTDDWTPDTELP